MRDVQHNIHRDEHVDTDVKHHQEGDTEVRAISIYIKHIGLIGQGDKSG